MVQSGIEDANEEKAKNEIINQLRLTAEGEFSDEDYSSGRLEDFIYARIPESIVKATAVFGIVIIL